MSTPEPGDTGGRSPDAARAHPVDINVDLKRQLLTITWQDGVQSRYDMGVLRRACPCATCVQQRQQPPAPATRLPILNIPAGVDRIEVVDARLVGHYAINLRWSDGHDTGIFDYRHLRALHEQAASQRSRSS